MSAAELGKTLEELLATSLRELGPENVEAAVAALVAQGVLEQLVGPDGIPRYRYARPDLYHQAHLDVIRQPAPAQRADRRRRAREQ